MTTYDWNVLRHSARLALAGIGFTAVGCLTAANAQSPATMGTNVKGVSIVAPPPAGFEPMAASANDRAIYAVPPEPNAATAPKQHAAWATAVSGIANRDTNATVELTGILNGPNRPAGSRTQGPDNSVNVTSYNWSGPSAVSSGTAFSKEAIIGVYIVPTARQAFGTCNGGWDWSSYWPGIDGNGSGDVLQGGVEVDAYCSGSTTEGFYSAWVEWYPYSESRVSSPAIHPGDELFVEVWNTSPTQGYVYFYNYSTQKSAEYSLTPPSGTTLRGNSIEWIVERPGVNGGLATLTNYIDSAWPEGIAWNYTSNNPTYYWEGQTSTPAGVTMEEITMLDNSGHGISSGAVENTDFVWFYNYGSSY